MILKYSNLPFYSKILQQPEVVIKLAFLFFLSTYMHQRVPILQILMTKLHYPIRQCKSIHVIVEILTIQESVCDCRNAKKGMFSTIPIEIFQNLARRPTLIF